MNALPHLSSDAAAPVLSAGFAFDFLIFAALILAPIVALVALHS